MRLQQIVEALDTELDRLGRLREIVAGLTGRPVTVQQPEDAVSGLMVEAIGGPQEAPKPAPRQRRARRTSAVKHVVVEREPRALTATIPKAPVVVSAAVLQREHAAKLQGRTARQQAEKRPEPGSLGSMIRALQRETAL